MPENALTQNVEIGYHWLVKTYRRICTENGVIAWTWVEKILGEIPSDVRKLKLRLVPPGGYGDKAPLDADECDLILKLMMGKKSPSRIVFRSLDLSGSLAGNEIIEDLCRHAFALGEECRLQDLVLANCDLVTESLEDPMRFLSLSRPLLRSLRRLVISGNRKFNSIDLSAWERLLNTGKLKLLCLQNTGVSNNELEKVSRILSKSEAAKSNLVVLRLGPPSDALLLSDRFFSLLKQFITDSTLLEVLEINGLGAEQRVALALEWGSKKGTFGRHSFELEAFRLYTTNPSTSVEVFSFKDVEVTCLTPPPIDTTLGTKRRYAPTSGNPPLRRAPNRSKPKATGSRRWRTRQRVRMPSRSRPPQRRNPPEFDQPRLVVREQRDTTWAVEGSTRLSRRETTPVINSHPHQQQKSKRRETTPIRDDFSDQSDEGSVLHPSPAREVDRPPLDLESWQTSLTLSENQGGDPSGFASEKSISQGSLPGGASLQDMDSYDSATSVSVSGGGERSQGDLDFSDPDDDPDPIPFDRSPEPARRKRPQKKRLKRVGHDGGLQGAGPARDGGGRNRGSALMMGSPRRQGEIEAYDPEIEKLHGAPPGGRVVRLETGHRDDGSDLQGYFSDGFIRPDEEIVYTTSASDGSIEQGLDNLDLPDCEAEIRQLSTPRRRSQSHPPPPDSTATTPSSPSSEPIVVVPRRNPTSPAPEPVTSIVVRRNCTSPTPEPVASIVVRRNSASPTPEPITWTVERRNSTSPTPEPITSTVQRGDSNEARKRDGKNSTPLNVEDEGGAGPSARPKKSKRALELEKELATLQPFYYDRFREKHRPGKIFAETGGYGLRERRVTDYQTSTLPVESPPPPQSQGESECAPDSAEEEPSPDQNIVRLSNDANKEPEENFSEIPNTGDMPNLSPDNAEGEAGPAAPNSQSDRDRDERIETRENKDQRNVATTPVSVVTPVSRGGRSGGKQPLTRSEREAKRLQFWSFDKMSEIVPPNLNMYLPKDDVRIKHFVSLVESQENECQDTDGPSSLPDRQEPDPENVRTTETNPLVQLQTSPGKTVLEVVPDSDDDDSPFVFS